MGKNSIDKYCEIAVKRGATHAKPIHPGSVITAPWVRLKCQFGCPLFGQSYCCPPDSPTPEQTRKVLDSYHRAILFHLELPYTPAPERNKILKPFYKMLTDLESEMFKAGHYRTLVFLRGHCRLCEVCSKLTGDPCKMGNQARPSMESTGIDVYQTARNNGFFIQPLSERGKTSNNYCLMLVD